MGAQAARTLSSSSIVMWVTRIAPAATAAIGAISLSRSNDYKNEGFRFPFVRRHVITQCQDSVSRHKSRSRALASSVPVPDKATKISKKGLLGQSHWIYCLVCSEEINKVYDLQRELGSEPLPQCTWRSIKRWVIIGL